MALHHNASKMYLSLTAPSLSSLLLKLWLSTPPLVFLLIHLFAPCSYEVCILCQNGVKTTLTCMSMLKTFKPQRTSFNRKQDVKLHWTSCFYHRRTENIHPKEALWRGGWHEAVSASLRDLFKALCLGCLLFILYFVAVPATYSFDVNSKDCPMSSGSKTVSKAGWFCAPVPLVSSCCILMWFCASLPHRKKRSKS